MARIMIMIMDKGEVVKYYVMATDYLNLLCVSVQSVLAVMSMGLTRRSSVTHCTQDRLLAKFATVLRHPVHPLSAESWATSQGGLPRPDAVCGAWARVFALQKERTEVKGVYVVAVVVELWRGAAWLFL